MGCEAVADDGFRLLGHKVLDISSRGILLDSEGRFARLGEEVIVTLKAPNSRVYFDAIGKVTRLINGRRLLDRRPAIGVELSEMDGWDRKLLAAKIDEFPEPTPRRAPTADYAAAIAYFAHT